tara:strand:+ start:48 stop:743 length:696 start_codon:yes stop_codon:yes gene_type:complete
MEINMATYENLKAILSLLGQEVKKNPLKALNETAQIINNPYAMGVSGKAAYDEYMKGNYPMAGINTGAMMLGAIPVVGPLASKGVRAAGNVAKEKLPSVFNMTGPIASKGKAYPTQDSLLKKKLEIEKEYKDYGENVDVTFHTTMAKDLNRDNFKYRPVESKAKAGFGKGPMIFTSGVSETPKYKGFGNRIYAVVHKKDKGIGGLEDDVSGRYEIGIPQSDVLEIFDVFDY